MTKKNNKRTAKKIVTKVDSMVPEVVTTVVPKMTEDAPDAIIVFTNPETPKFQLVDSFDNMVKENFFKKMFNRVKRYLKK